MADSTHDSNDSPVVNHVGQCTADLGAARRFYVELLGFEVERELSVPDAAAGPFLGIEPPVGLTAVYLRLGDFVLELMSFDRDNNPPSVSRVVNEQGLTHLSISVVDLASVVARVGDYGGSVVNELATAAMVRDPDGQLLELLPMSYRKRLERRIDWPE